MSKASRPPRAKTTQEASTKPQPRDRQGRVLDEFGLPLSGPARVRELTRLDKPDPRVEPGAWAAKVITVGQSGGQIAQVLAEADKSTAEAGE